MGRLILPVGHTHASPGMERSVYTGFSALRDGYVLVVEAHVCDAEDIRARIREAASIADRSGVHRMVVDTMHVHADWQPAELETLAEFAHEHLAKIQRIGLARDSRKCDDPFAILVRQFATAGVPIRQFSDIGEARRWACA